MISRARTVYGAALPILIAGPPNINKDALGPTKPIADQREAKLKELGAAFAELAKERHCEFISLHGVVPASSLIVLLIEPVEISGKPTSTCSV